MMANPPEENMGMWSYLRKVDDSKTDWAVRMRAVRVYHVPQRNGSIKTMDIVFHDKEGTRIHVKVNYSEFKLYKSKIKEDGVYALRHFSVQPNSSSFKTTSHPYLLNINSKTWFRDLTPKDESLIPPERRFPRFRFNFRTFASIHAEVDLDQTMLTDVIGKVVATTNIRGGGEARRMEITLQDIEGVKLDCTLWNNYIEEFNAKIGQGKLDPILIIQFCRPRRYLEVNSVSTSFHVTKLLLDGDALEALEYKRRFAALNDPVANKTASTITITQSSEVEDDAASGNLKITTIHSLLGEKEDGLYWVKGEIVSILNYNDWCYLGCDNCNRKVVPEGDSFKCSECNLTMPYGLYRYKVIVSVMDDTNQASFILWDRECIDLVGLKAGTLRKMMLKRTGDVDDFPTEIERAVLKKKGLFKTVLRNASHYVKYNGPRTFGVNRMIIDLKVLSKYEASCSSTQIKAEWEGFDFEEELYEKVGSSIQDSNEIDDTREVFMDKIGAGDSVKRDLGDDFSSSSNGKKKKTI